MQNLRASVLALHLAALALPAAAAVPTTGSDARMTLRPAPLSLVEQELAAVAAGPQALLALFRSSVRSPAEGTLVLQSPAFLRLAVADQRLLLEGLRAQNLELMVQIVEDLPFHLRAEQTSRTLDELESRVMARASRMSRDQQAQEILPSRVGMFDQPGGRRAFAPDAQRQRLLRDDAIEGFEKIDSAWLTASSEAPILSVERLVEARLLVARNLHFAGAPTQAETVFRELAALDHQRAALKDQMVFTGRQVVLVAGDNDAEEKDCFGKEATRQNLLAKDPSSLLVVRSEDQGSKKRLAKAIAETSDLTLVFDSHGREDSLKFAGGLKATELAAMLAGRKVPGNVIVIVSACFGHDYSRRVLEALRREGAPLPVFIVPEEFGQVTLTGSQENRFLAADLGLSQRSERTTLGDLFGRAALATSVYAPTGTGFRQIL